MRYTILALAVALSASALQAQAPVNEPGSAQKAPVRITRFHVNIDASGAPTSCEITGPSGDASLDALTCKLLMRRAKFKPAVDPFGKPIPDTFDSAIRWDIPKEERKEPPPPPPPPPPKYDQDDWRYRMNW